MRERSSKAIGKPGVRSNEASGFAVFGAIGREGKPSDTAAETGAASM
jgi:hypothetical protein